MKRTAYLFEFITDFDNLRLAYLKARRGKSEKQDVINFEKNINENLARIRNELLDGSYHMKPYRFFTITDPKERLICAAEFEDRIVHHAIINILEPVFERHFIFHTYGCRKGKGTLKAVYFAQSCGRSCPYFLKLDVRKFFDNINHSILKWQLQKIIKDKKCLSLFDVIIDSYFTKNDAGLPIGNLTSQFMANFYLSELDHFIVEQLKPKYYVRYMDDMIIFGKSFQKLKHYFDIIKIYCKKNLALELKIPVLNYTKDGVPFLGYLIFPSCLQVLNKKMKYKMKKIKQIIYYEKKGYITKEKSADRITAVMAGVNV